MAYMSTIAGSKVAISMSESPDMSILGLSDAHLRDAMDRLALQLLSSGASLAYGGDLRPNGFTEWLFELVHRYRRGTSEIRIGVTNYFAWPAHISKATDELEAMSAGLADTGELVCLTKDGHHMDPSLWSKRPLHQPTDEEWSTGLTSMRRVMRKAADARVVLGGPVADYKGIMPGIAEEALLSLQKSQPLFLLGGFGGCARDIAETLGLVDRWAGSRPAWPGREKFEDFSSDLNNGLSEEENATLALTPHIDRANVLVLRGLHRLGLRKEEEMNQANRHKIFISFHHDDQEYKDLFVRMMGDDIVDRSVEEGDINDRNIKTETIRQYIRDDFIADATVTVVLIGPCTWQRKHVDWEIGSSLRKTNKNSRCGLIGILLPNHPDFGTKKYRPRLIPPRLADNSSGEDRYARIYDWPGQQDTHNIRQWIHRAFERRMETPPDNSRDQFGRNRTGDCSDGWKD
ncbi:MAG: TIR domain-containing protein [Gemmatimonadota bacterium]|nr:TIR domain-containing protein [Gemmatimonadota bacterium]